MNYSFEIRQEASKEYINAFVWYEEQQENLGYRFKKAFDAKLDQICANPYHYKVLWKNCHEALTETFPFSIIYKINEKDKLITVIAIFHTSRNPKKKFRKI